MGSVSESTFASGAFARWTRRVGSFIPDFCTITREAARGPQPAVRQTRPLNGLRTADSGPRSTRRDRLDALAARADDGIDELAVGVLVAAIHELGDGVAT